MAQARRGHREKRGAFVGALGAADGYTLEEGTAAVRAARAVVEAAVRGANGPPAVDLPESFSKAAGVFTTLVAHPLGELRGCIGFVEPVLPLREAILATAAAAALEDGRFDPVQPMELEHLVVEVSLLTAPQPLQADGPDGILRLVEVGRHGLIVRSGRRGGLLLPQVAPEWGWSSREFLEHTCAKGGFEPDFWKSPDARVFTFEAEVFAESAPYGPVVRRPNGERESP